GRTGFLRQLRARCTVRRQRPCHQDIWHDHRWGSVVEGTKAKALHHLSFGCYADDLPRLKARIEEQGVQLIDPPPGFESNGFWFRNHEGVLIEVKVGPKVSP